MFFLMRFFTERATCNWHSFQIQQNSWKLQHVFFVFFGIQYMQIGASDRIDMLCAAFLNKIVMFLCYADFVYDFTALKHAVMDCSAQAISQHRQIPFLDLPIRFTDLFAAPHSLTRFVSFACLPHKERMINHE